MDIETCLAEGYLQKINPNKEIQNKEISSAEYDLKLDIEKRGILP